MTEHTKKSQEAGYLVTAISGVLVLAILGVLCFHIYMIENPQTFANADFDEIKCQTAECSIEKARLMLESDVLIQRTGRVQSALSSRLFISVVAEIVALTLVVLGGVLIFDRVQSEREGLTGKVAKGDDKGSIYLSSSFPGVLLCFFGAVTLVFAMWFPTREGAQIQVLDLPVFIADANTERNFVWRRVAGTNITLDKTTAPQTKGSPSDHTNKITPQFTEEPEGKKK